MVLGSSYIRVRTWVKVRVVGLGFRVFYLKLSTSELPSDRQSKRLGMNNSQLDNPQVEEFSSPDSFRSLPRSTYPKA